MSKSRRLPTPALGERRTESVWSIKHNNIVRGETPAPQRYFLRLTWPAAFRTPSIRTPPIRTPAFRTDTVALVARVVGTTRTTIIIIHFPYASRVLFWRCYTGDGPGVWGRTRPTGRKNETRTRTGTGGGTPATIRSEWTRTCCPSSTDWIWSISSPSTSVPCRPPRPCATWATFRCRKPPTVSGTPSEQKRAVRVHAH